MPPARWTRTVVEPQHEPLGGDALDQPGTSQNGAQSERPLGILACAGPLPVEVAEAGAKQGRRVHIVAIDGFAGEAVTRFSHEHVNLGQLGRILASFERAGVREIVIAGAMQRPSLLGLRIDWGFVRNLPAILTLTRGGDDSVLRRVVRFFEEQGLTVLGASDVAPGLLAPLGSLSAAGAGETDLRAIARAANLIGDLGRFDIGQGVVANPEGIVAVEGVRGTDAMLRDLGEGGAGAGAGRGGVLVKLAKPGQEMRVDLPTIGPETVRLANMAGLAGIAIGAGGAIVLERERVAEAADAVGLFVVGIAPPIVARPDPAPIEAPVLRVAGRRAPTPSERRDIVIGRGLADVLRVHGGGRASILSREHVLAVSGSFPLPAFIAAQGRASTWGRGSWSGRRGVLVVDTDANGTEPPEKVLDRDLFKAALDNALAGIVVLAPLPDGERRDEIVGWANEAGVFLMCFATEP